MKHFLTLAVAAIALAAVQSASVKLSEDMQDKFLEAVSACKEETPELDIETLEKMKNHDLVDTPEAKKFSWCFHKHIGFQNPDGSFNVEKMKEQVFKVTGTHEYDGVIDECTKEDHHDGIKNSWEYSVCALPKLPKLELDL